MSVESTRLTLLQMNPAAFRDSILVDANAGPVRFGEVLDDWQRQDFEALDCAWQRVAGQAGEPEFQRGYLERPRGHSKSTDIAICSAWALFASRRKLAGYVAAADRDQAGLIRDAIDKLVRLNPWLGNALEIKRDRIRNPHTGSELLILSSDAPTSYGLTPDFIICDELTHWKSRDLWDSLLSATAKRANCLLLVIANAGFQDSWQWDTREAIRMDAAWYFHRLDGPHASWITSKHLDEQKRLLPPKVFRRLWQNDWADGAGDALESNDIDAAISLTGELLQPEAGWAYFSGLDIGLSRDASALIVLGKHVGYSKRIQQKKPCFPNSVRALVDLGIMDAGKESAIEFQHHAGSGRLKLVAVRIWKPNGIRIELEQIENEILKLHRLFGLNLVSFDPWQAEYLAQRLRRQNVVADAVSFVPSSLQEMATATLDAFREKQIELFPDSDLLADLRALRVVEKQYGYRLESPTQNRSEGTRHGDAATALSIALRAGRSIRLPSAAMQNRNLVLWPQVGSVQ